MRAVCDHRVEQGLPDHTGEDSLWRGQDTSQQWKHNGVTPAAL